MKEVAALFVEKSGTYYGLDGVDPWDKERDARGYVGPHPVVAHPPCERWGRYWFGGPSAKVRRRLGDDGGCFRSDLRSVFLFGGVLEHPEASKAFASYGIQKPDRSISERQPVPWPSRAFVTCVEQGAYGHPARKATWLLVCDVPKEKLPVLRWGPSGKRTRLDEGFHSKEERARARANGAAPIKRLSRRENLATPPEFRDLLLSIARSVG